MATKHKARKPRSEHPIRAARRAAGKTQHEVGEHLGVEKAAVSKWETGRCLPRPAQAAGLVNLLPGLTLEAIYSGAAA